MADKLLSDDEVFGTSPTQPKQLLSDEEVFNSPQQQAADLARTQRGDRTWGEVAQDTALSLGQGAIGLGQSAVGLGEMAANAISPGGAAQRQMLLRDSFHPEQAQQYLESLKSARGRKANQNVAEAKGFGGTLVALANNPEAVLDQVLQSLPGMLAAGGAVRARAAQILQTGGPEALKAALPQLATLGGIAEGAQTAGQIVNKGTEEGKPYSQTELPAIAAGAGDALISKYASKIPGFRDAEVALAEAGMGATKKGWLEAAKTVAKTAFGEGVLEELPQSMQEQVFQNIAEGKPWDEGVMEAGAQGMVAGIAMGGGAGAKQHAMDSLKASRDKMPSMTLGGQDIKGYSDQELRDLHGDDTIPADMKVKIELEMRRRAQPQGVQFPAYGTAAATAQPVQPEATQAAATPAAATPDEAVDAAIARLEQGSEPAGSPATSAGPAGDLGAGNARPVGGMEQQPGAANRAVPAGTEGNLEQGQPTAAVGGEAPGAVSYGGAPIPAVPVGQQFGFDRTQDPRTQIADIAEQLNVLQDQQRQDALKAAQGPAVPQPQLGQPTPTYRPMDQVATSLWDLSRRWDNAQLVAQGKAEPLPVTQDEIYLHGLNRALQQRSGEIEAATGVRPPVLKPVADPQVAKSWGRVADALQQITGIRPVAFEAHEASAPNGFEIDGRPHVNLARTELPAVYVAMHELKHVAERAAEEGNKDAQAITSMVHSVYNLIDDDFKRSYAANYLWAKQWDGQHFNIGGQQLTMDQALQHPALRSEMTADFMGQRAADPEFWNALAKRKPATFGEFVKGWLRTLKFMIGKLKGYRGKDNKHGVKAGSYSDIESHIKDLQKAYRIAEDAMIRWAGAVHKAREAGGTQREVNTETMPAFKREEVQQAAKKRAKVSDENKASYYVGAPSNVQKPQDLATMRASLKKMAKAGEPGRMWYEKSSKAILDVVNGDKAEAERLVKLIALYSPNATVPANTSMALTAYWQWKAGLPIKAGLGLMNAKAEAMLRQGKEWSGIKTNSFYMNLMTDIDPSKIQKGVSTMDIWMARAFGYGHDANPSTQQYLFMERETARLAKELGWEPHQVQAAVWTAIKAQNEGKTVEKAGEDFSDALRLRTMQLSWEATPGESTGVLPGLLKAPVDQKFEYLTAIQDALTEDGKDMIAEMANIPQGRTMLGYSAWKGDIGAGAQTFIPAAPGGAGQRNWEIKPEIRKQMNLYAAIRGYVLAQEAVVYHLPLYEAAVSKHNGFELRSERPLSEDEVKTLYQAIHDKFGTWELAPAYRPNGVRVLNYTDIANKDFQAGMKEVMESLADDFGGGSLTAATFKADGDYISNNWNEDPHGEGYLRQIEAERPDLQRAVQRVKTRVQAVNRDFSKKYGWGNPRFSAAGASQAAAEVAAPVGTEAFREWFGDSQIKDSLGRPRVMYHGTARDITVFKPKQADAIFLTFSPSFADDFAHLSKQWIKNNEIQLTPEQDAKAREVAKSLVDRDYPNPDDDMKPVVERLKQMIDGDHPPISAEAYDYLVSARDQVKEPAVDSAQNIMPLYVRAEKTFDPANPQHMLEVAKVMLAKRGVSSREAANWVRSFQDDANNWELIEREDYQEVIRDLGYDSFWVTEGGVKNLAVYKPNQVKSATGNIGSYSRTSDDIRYSRPLSSYVPNNPTATVGWAMPAPKMVGVGKAKFDADKFTYEMQDRFVDLRKAVEAISQISTVADDFDPGLGETLYHGRVGQRTADFMDSEVDPLAKALNDSGLKIEEVEDYLLAKHAKERNAQVAKVNPNMPDGGAGSNSKGTLMTNAAAAAYLAAIPADKMVKLRGIEAQVRDIIKGTEDLLVSSGLEKQDTIDAWHKAYKNYVPLFKDEANEDHTAHPVGSGFNTKGPSSKRSMGSSEKVTNILAHVLMQREAAITRSEKNRVAKRLYVLAMAHPNPDFWTTDRPPQIRYIDPRSGLVTTRIDPLYKSAPNVLAVRVNGEDRIVTFNRSNEQAARLGEALKNLDSILTAQLATSALGPVIRAIRAGTHWVAAVNTQYNIVFGLTNFTRDMQSAMLNLSTTPISNRKAQVMKDAIPAIRGIVANMYGKKGGQWAKLFDQFASDGGTTGYRDMFMNPEDRAKQLVKEMRKFERSAPTKMVFGALEALDHYNTAIENGVRLAAYKAALDNGLSRERAAEVAKGLTVNFNRKGRVAQAAGVLYAFFNASVQGSARMLETLRGPSGRKIIVGGLLLGVLQGFMFAAAGLDDEDELTEYTKSKNLIIPLYFFGADKASKKYLMIPMAQGFNLLPTIGRQLFEGAHDPKKLPKIVGEVLSSMLDTFNPMGGQSFMDSVTPTVLDPVLQISRNKDFKGDPIYTEDRNPEDPSPGYTRFRKSAWHWVIGTAKAINKATGGDDDTPGKWSPTPEELAFFTTSILGGIGREVGKLADALGAAADPDREMNPNRAPMVNRFYGQVDEEQSQTRKYYNSEKELSPVKREVKGAARRGEDVQPIFDKHPGGEQFKAYEHVDRAIGKLSKLRREEVLNEKPGWEERVREYDAQILKLRSEQNRRYEQAKRAAQQKG